MKAIFTFVLLIFSISLSTSQICEVTLEERDHTTCFGGTDGRLKVKAQGVNGVLAYKWHTGATTREIKNLSPGFYTVTVTCFYGKTTKGFQVGQPAAIGVGYFTFNVDCYGSKTGSLSHSTTTGGTSPYTYKWSNGAKTSSISKLSAGSYTLTVTDSKKCTATFKYKITQPSKLSVSTLYSDNPSCYQGKSGRIKVSGKGGVTPYTFKWSNGTKGDYVSNLNAGSYTVTITDKNKCKATRTYKLTEPSKLSIKVTEQINVDCHANKTGSIEVDGQGGSLGYSYSWSNGAFGKKLSGVSSGKYTVTITDKNKCETSKSYSITQPDVLEVTQLSIEHNDCFGEKQGSLEANGKGGTSPYSFLWSNGKTTAKISGLEAGKYTVDIIDDNKCSATMSYDITEPKQLVLNDIEIINNPCYSSAEGSIEVKGGGGVPPYKYLWNNGEKSAKISNLTAGDYNVEITDNNDCTMKKDYTITEPEVLSLVEISIVNNLCHGDENGTIQIDILGGTAPYETLWSTGDKTLDIQKLKAGIYDVEIEDANGCTQSAKYEVTEPEQLELELVSHRNNGCGESEAGAIEVLGNGGTSPYQYLWSDGSTSAKISQLKQGEHTVIITDNNSCKASEKYKITKEEELQIDSLVIQDIKCFGDNDGLIDVIIENGQAPYMFTWNNGDTTHQIENLSPGKYDMIVTDARGCERLDTFEIEEPELLELEKYKIEDVRCNGEKNGTIETTIKGGTGQYTYLWSNGEKTQSISKLASDTYKVDIEDENGCMIDESFDVTQPDLLTYVIDKIKKDNGSGNGNIEMSIVGGNGGNAYQWTGPSGYTSTDEDPENLMYGSYQCTIADLNKCQITTEKVEVEKLTTSISNLDKVEVNVYPNPTSGKVMISSGESWENLSIYTLDGQFVEKIINNGAISSINLNLYTRKIGTYILMIKGRDFTHIERVILE